MATLHYNLPTDDTGSTSNDDDTTAADYLGKAVVIFIDAASQAAIAFGQTVEVIVDNLGPIIREYIESKQEEIIESPHSFPKPRTMPWNRHDQFPVVRRPSRPRRRRRRMAVP